MRQRISLLLLSLLFAAMTAQAIAQQGPPPREMMLPRRIFFALRKPVATELALTSEGKQKIIDAFQGSLEVMDNGIRLSLNGSQDVDDMEQSALSTLSADQRKHLEELWIRKFGGLTLLDEKIAKKVGVTDDQEKQLNDLVEKGAKDLSDLMGGEPTPESQKKVDALREDYGKKMAALLTHDQKKVFEGLAGKPSEH